MKLVFTFTNPESNRLRRIETIDFPSSILPEPQGVLTSVDTYQRYLDWFLAEETKMSSKDRTDIKQRHFIHGIYLTECLETKATLLVERIE